MLPKSSLSVATRMLQGGSILISTVGMPEEQFLGSDQTRKLLTGASGLVPVERCPAPSAAIAPHVNLTPIFASVLVPLLKAHPKTTIQDLCWQLPDVGLKELVVGKRGIHCSNNNIIGRCNEKRCQYQHRALQPSPKKVDKVKGHLQQIVDAAFKQGPAPRQEGS